MNASAGFVQGFDYSQFKSQDLAAQAQETLSNFKAFVRQTFDGIIQIGQELQDIYEKCLTNGTNGKKIFKQWLESKSFGASIYIAQSAMQLYNWFKDLDPRLQRLIRENVQDWKVSALRHLKYLASDVIEVAVTTGKKTASQLKQLSAGVDQKVVKLNEGKKSLPCQEQSASTPELAPGVRIVVQNESTGLNGCSGIITSVGNNDDFCVLLDQTIAQGTLVQHLLKSNQLQPEAIKFYAEIEKLKAETIKEYQLKNAEEEQGQFIKLRDGARVAAEAEIASFRKHAQNITDKYQALLQELEAKEKEIARLNSLDVENQRLQQRVTELEHALLGASKDSWNNTFTTQAAKVLNSNIEKQVPKLLSKIERLENDLQEKDALIEQMQQTSAPDSVILSFGEIAENLGWNGWRRSGYRDSNGTLHKGINAISAFVSDLTREFQLEIAF
jgi:uncharacterized protein YoxC